MILLLGGDVRHSGAAMITGLTAAGVDGSAVRTTSGVLAYTSIAFPYGHEATVSAAGVATVRAWTSYVPDPRVGEVPGRPPTVVTGAQADQLRRMEQDVRELRGRCDVLVVSCHWGVAGQAPCDYQREIGRAAIDAGPTW